MEIKTYNVPRLRILARSCQDLARNTLFSKSQILENLGKILVRFSKIYPRLCGLIDLGRSWQDLGKILQEIHKAKSWQDLGKISQDLSKIFQDLGKIFMKQDLDKILARSCKIL